MPEGRKNLSPCPPSNTTLHPRRGRGKDPGEGDSIKAVRKANSGWGQSRKEIERTGIVRSVVTHACWQRLKRGGD